MPEYILQISVNIKANDDPEARFKSKRIVDMLAQTVSIEKVGLWEIHKGCLPRIVSVKPTLKYPFSL